MKFVAAAFALAVAAPASPSLAFAPTPFGVRPGTSVQAEKSESAKKDTLLAEIRGPTEKSQELRFGWDGTTALGGAVEVATPARMLDEIRAAGETVPDECQLFNANVEMNSGDLMFEDVIEMIDSHYESQLLEFKNGDMLNKPGENEGSAKVLSYAALSEMDKDTTLKLWGQYYREVLADKDGDSHQNIRNFLKYGWEGVPFENGIALTRKNTGDGEWDAFAESWMP